jgi:hypothetical protein
MRLNVTYMNCFYHYTINYQPLDMINMQSLYAKHDDAKYGNGWIMFI